MKKSAHPPLVAARFDATFVFMTLISRAARTISGLATLASLVSLATMATCVAGCDRDAAPPPARSVPSNGATPPPGTNAAGASAGVAPTSGELAVGKPPPDFSAKDQGGVELKLSALKGKPVVVYFYPKDETPGCTKEACAFRDAWTDLDKKGVVLIGISADTAESHGAFAKHHQLPFHLVSDESGGIARSFGVPVSGGYLGRQSFVVGADGNLKKIYREVDVTKHAREILVDVGS